MIWTSKGYKLKDRVGEQRVISKFYWLPEEFSGTWVWLERFDTKQEIKSMLVWGSPKYKWETILILRKDNK